MQISSLICIVVFIMVVIDIVMAAPRWLAPGGTTVPRRDTLWAAPCTHRRAIHRRPAADALADLDLTPLAATAAHTWWRQDLAADDLAGEPRRWGEAIFGEEPGKVTAEMEWELEEAAEIDGMAAWFRADLGFEVGFDTAPGAGPESCYGQAFLPWPRPLETRAGDHLQVALRADPTGDHYTWGWSCELRRRGATVETFRQSTFHADALGLIPGGLVPGGLVPGSSG